MHRRSDCTHKQHHQLCEEGWRDGAPKRNALSRRRCLRVFLYATVRTFARAPFVSLRSSVCWWLAYDFVSGVEATCCMACVCTRSSAVFFCCLCTPCPSLLPLHVDFLPFFDAPAPTLSIRARPNGSRPLCRSSSLQRSYYFVQRRHTRTQTYTYTETEETRILFTRTNTLVSDEKRIVKHTKKALQQTSHSFSVPAGLSVQVQGSSLSHQRAI